MDGVQAYGNLLKKQIGPKPARARRMLRLGLAYERARLRLRAGVDREIPKSLTLLNRIAVASVSRAFAHPERTAWVNLFAPTELVLAFGLTPLSIECFSSFMGGFRIEDRLLVEGENAGLSDTLCAYHKAFLGAAECGILEKPLMTLTTTLACDCNVNSFRHIGQRFGVPGAVLDIPYEYNDGTVRYVTRQLEETVALLEKRTGRRLDPTALAAVLECENRTRRMHTEALRLMASRDFPCTLTLHMFKLFATHLLLGSAEIENYYERLLEELRRAPEQNAVRVLWIHLIPFYEKTLQGYFNNNARYRIMASDFDIDGDPAGPLDPEKPLESLARKMILNIYDGPFERKTDAVLRLAEALRPDGVICFGHWGCKQSIGGAPQLKRAFDGRDVPFLLLDGDGLDRRNSMEGQIKTRVDAFMEMLEARA
ncbi:MAG: 2-hydroxyacyl-CoA dehydratase family protein [Clostridiales bacterium]|nr:2-hydroxyacyl-CoA dehydratase family protein [Clostridiales bacterium]